MGERRLEGKSLTHILIFTHHSASYYPPARFFLFSHNSIRSMSPRLCAAQFKMALRGEQRGKQVEIVPTEMVNVTPAGTAATLVSLPRSKEEERKLAALQSNR